MADYTDDSDSGSVTQDGQYEELVAELLDILGEKRELLSKSIVDTNKEFQRLKNSPSLTSRLLGMVLEKGPGAELFQTAEGELSLQQGMIVNLKSLQREMNQAYFDNNHKQLRARLNQATDIEIGILLGTIVLGCLASRIKEKSRLNENIDQSFRLSLEMIATAICWKMRRTMESMRAATDERYWKKDRTKKDILKSNGELLAGEAIPLADIVKRMELLQKDEQQAIAALERTISSLEKQAYGKPIPSTLTARIIDARQRLENLKSELDNGEIDYDSGLAQIADTFAATYGADCIFRLFLRTDRKREEQPEVEEKHEYRTAKKPYAQANEHGTLQDDISHNSEVLEQNTTSYRERKPQEKEPVGILRLFNSKKKQAGSELQKKEGYSEVAKKLISSAVYWYYDISDSVAERISKTTLALRRILNKIGRQEKVMKKEQLPKKNEKNQEASLKSKRKVESIEEIIETGAMQKIPERQETKQAQKKHKGIMEKIAMRLKLTRKKTQKRLSPGQPTPAVVNGLYTSGYALGMGNADEQDKVRADELKKILKEIEALGKDLVVGTETGTYVENPQAERKVSVWKVDTELQGLSYGSKYENNEAEKVQQKKQVIRKSIELMLSSNSATDFMQGMKALREMRETNKERVFIDASEKDQGFAMLIKNFRNIQKMATQGSADAIKALLEIAVSNIDTPVKEFSKRFLIEKQDEFAKAVPNYRNVTRLLITDAIEILGKRKNPEAFDFLLEYAGKLAELSLQDGFDFIDMLATKIPDTEKKTFASRCLRLFDKCKLEFLFRRWEWLRGIQLFRKGESKKALDLFIVKKSIEMLNNQETQEHAATAIASYIVVNKQCRSETATLVKTAIIDKGLSEHLKDNQLLKGFCKAAAKAIWLEQKTGSSEIMKAVEEKKSRENEHLNEFLEQALKTENAGAIATATPEISKLCQKANCIFLYGIEGQQKQEAIEAIANAINNEKQAISCAALKPNVIVDDIDFDYGYGMIIVNGRLIATGRKKETISYQKAFEMIESAYEQLEKNQFRSEKKAVGLKLKQKEFIIAEPRATGFFIMEKDLQKTEKGRAELNPRMITDSKTHDAIYKASKKLRLPVYVIDINTMEIKPGEFNNLLQRFTAAESEEGIIEKVLDEKA